MRRALAALVALVLFGTASTAEASPEDIFGYGPRGPAMAGTGTAWATSFDAAYANPALLSAMRARTLAFGMQTAVFDLHASGRRLPVDPMKGLVIGAGVPIPFGGVLTDRVGIALAFYSPTKIIIRGRILYPETASFPLLADRAQSLGVRLGVGADIGYGFRVGGGFAALAEIAGDVIVATDASGRVGSRVEDQLVATYAPIFGASWETKAKGLGDLRIGAVYRGTLDARFAVEIDATKLSSLNIPIFNIAGLAQYDPTQIGLEGALKRGSWLFAVGLTYKRWSAYPGLIEPTIRCPDDEPDCGALPAAKVPMSDTLVPRLAVDDRIALSRSYALHLRAGYFLEPTPTPSTYPSSRAFEQTTKADVDVPTRQFDATRHVFTIGTGLDLAGRATLDGWSQLHIMPSRTIGTPPAGDAKVRGTVVAAGMVLGVTF